MTKDLIGRGLGVALALLVSYLFISFVKWDLNLADWREFERGSVVLLPALLVAIRGFLSR